MAKRVPLPAKPQKRASRVFERPDLTDRSTGSPAYKAWERKLGMDGETKMRKVDPNWSPPDDWVFWSDGNWYTEKGLTSAGWRKENEGWVHKNDDLQYEQDLKAYERELSVINKQNADLDNADRQAAGRYSTAVTGTSGIRSKSTVKRTLLSAGPQESGTASGADDTTPDTQSQEKKKRLINHNERRKKGETSRKRLLGK